MNPLSAESRAIRSLKKLPLVEALDQELWARLIPHISIRELAAGEILFNSGRASENLYLVTDGELGLTYRFHHQAHPLLLKTRKRGDTAGDFAVLNGGEHLVTATAIKKTRLACFPRFAFELLSDIEPKVLAHVYETAAELSHRVMLARVYSGLFGEIDPDTLDRLLEASTVRHLKNGEILFEEGDEPDGLHVVISGRLNIETCNVENRSVMLAEVTAHQTIGEFALLSASDRSATVYATRESIVALLPREKFDELIMTQPALLASVSRQIVKRMLTNAKSTDMRSTDSNFVIIPLDSRLPLRRFVQQLRKEFRGEESCLAIDNQLFDTLYGKRGASKIGFTDLFNSSISAWLDDKEDHFENVLYVANQNWNAWSQRCVNRADRILLVANATEDNSSELREIETRLHELYRDAKFKPRIELVLLHPTHTQQPSDTDRWIQWRDISAFHHIRMNDKAHFGRLYRRMTGKARGIVFSGGGARGYAHLGVHRAIEEAKFQVDYIGGSSMGGLLGAAMALGLSYQDVYRMSSRYANARALFDYTLPMVALMKSAKLTHFCREVYSEAKIEDLWIPFFCVSSNLSSGKEVVHDRGYLWRAVRATVSLPGIFSPVPDNQGDLLIDGAVLNTFPVDVMHQKLSGGNIIGVNVSQIPEIRECFEYGTSLSGWKLLLHRINPFKDILKTPKIAETLLRSTDIKSIQRLNETRQMLDTLIEPDVSEIRLLDFKSFAAISEIGYETAKPFLTEHSLATQQMSSLASAGYPQLKDDHCSRTAEDQLRHGVDQERQTRSTNDSGFAGESRGHSSKTTSIEMIAANKDSLNVLDPNDADRNLVEPEPPNPDHLGPDHLSPEPRGFASLDANPLDAKPLDSEQVNSTTDNVETIDSKQVDLLAQGPLFAVAYSRQSGKDGYSTDEPNEDQSGNRDSKDVAPRPG